MVVLRSKNIYVFVKSDEKRVKSVQVDCILPWGYVTERSSHWDKTIFDQSLKTEYLVPSPRGKEKLKISYYLKHRNEILKYERSFEKKWLIVRSKFHQDKFLHNPLENLI